MDEATQKAIEEIIATLGSLIDRSGKPGVDQEAGWVFRPSGCPECLAFARGFGSGTLPLGEATAAADAAVRAVKAKIDDYFARCKLSAFDSRATVALNRSDAEFVSLAAKVLTGQSEEIAQLPLARVEAGRPLPLGAGVNPAWSAAISALAASAIAPLLSEGQATLSEGDWLSLQAKLAPYQAWMAAKPGHTREELVWPACALCSPAASKIGSPV